MSAEVLSRRPVRGVTALRAVRMWRPTPYQAACLLFWLLMTLAYWRLPLCCDTGRYAAAVDRLRADLLHPRHPVADLPGTGSAAYSPYTVLQGVFARLTGLTGWEVVRLAGPLNLVVLLTGVGRFVRMLTPRPWAPVLALAATALLWGTEPASWGAYLGLMPMTVTVGYPAACAIGLTFWAWALTGARAHDTRPVRYVGPNGLRGLTGFAGLGVLYGVVLLTDPAVAAGAAVGALAVVAGRQRAWRPAVAARWALTCGTAVLTAAVWPYFDVLDVLALARGGGADGVHRALYDDLAARSWLALLGLPALWLRARRGSWRDPLVLMFAADCLVVAGGWLSGHYAYGRVLGLAAVGPQCALAVELAAPRPWPRWRWALATVAAGGACLGLLTVQAGAVVPRALDPVGFVQPPDWPTYWWAARYIRPGETVIADGYRAVHALPGYGPVLAAPPWPDASLPERDRLRRLADVRAYLSPTSTRAQRRAVVRRYRVRWLLLPPRRRVPEEAVVVAWSGRTGEVLARVGP
ncbi:hypothetical protein [Streptomyces mangrovisoli]|uniref:Integral membrane protein n=1 Tax=Streptomyces mangrovisoli TaxID=1428628 RepID=A0A1J4NWN0_9ACTN|nr:hypothetical protein [Streptomyces mangrovisoli]OIJ65900.1 hypothetical protein WN71_021275 [Streptomyces mangrovisoli]